MQRQPKTIADAANLLSISELLTTTIRTIVNEWAKEHRTQNAGVAKSDEGAASAILPTSELHEAQRRILAITGALIELVSEPSNRVQEVACQYWESRALYIVAERRIPDVLVAAGEKGLSTEELSGVTKIECLKLGKYAAAQLFIS